MSLTSFAFSYTTTTTTTSSAGGGSATFIIILILALIVAVIFLAGAWKMYVKAGKPGWGVIIPFYNTYLLAEIGGKPGWWGIVAPLIAFIPFVGWIGTALMLLVIAMGVGRNFGKDLVWSVILLWVIQPIGQLILGFGKAQYVGDGQIYGGFDLPPMHEPGDMPASHPTDASPATPVEPLQSTETTREETSPEPATDVSETESSQQKEPENDENNPTNPSGPMAG